MRDMKYVLAVLIIGGVVFSVWDYKQWRKAETAKYGHGPVASEAVALTKTYFGKGYRLKYPEGWTASKDKLREATGEVEVGFKAMTTKENLVDIVDREAGGVTRERDNITNENTVLTVLTWEGADEVRQKGFAKKGEKLVIMEVKLARQLWSKWEKTIREMYRSLVVY